MEFSVIKTGQHIYGVVFNCATKQIIFSCSSIKLKSKTANIEVAKKVGEMVVKRLKELNISQLYFNKLEYKFHGKVKAVVETLRLHEINI